MHKVINWFFHHITTKYCFNIFRGKIISLPIYQTWAQQLDPFIECD